VFGGILQQFFFHLLQLFSNVSAIVGFSVKLLGERVCACLCIPPRFCFNAYLFACPFDLNGTVLLELDELFEVVENDVKVYGLVLTERVERMAFESGNGLVV